MATVKIASPSDSAAASTTVEPDASSIFLALAGSKHKRKLGATLNESAATGPNDFAKRQLEKLGWKEGTGLGKKRDGRSTHIRVQQRAHESGLGSSNVDIDPVVSAEQWWKSSVGNTLAKLSSAANKKKKSKKSKKNDKPKLEYTDEELFQATGGVRFGMRAQTQQHSKWKRAESNISEEEEQKAKQKTEWNGLTAPRVVLSSISTGTTTDSNSMDEKGEKKNKKKKRSRDGETDSSLPSSSSDETLNNKEEEIVRSKKKRKGIDDIDDKAAKKKDKRNKKKRDKKEKKKDS